MNLRVPLNAGKFLSSCTIGGFSRRAELHEWVTYFVWWLNSINSMELDFSSTSLNENSSNSL
jgi:hypothetical protein